MAIAIMEQQRKDLAEALSYALTQPTKVREAFGSAADAGRRNGTLFITPKDEKRYSKRLIAVAREVCQPWHALGSEEGIAFSAKKWMESAEKVVYSLREASAETALAFLLRKGIQNVANDWYLAVPRDWQDYCMVAQSTTFAEWYGPLYGSTIAGRVPRGSRFPEGRIIGEDTALVNQKFGLIESFDRELFDDDQTGQIKQRAQRLGAGMAITESAYASLRFIGAAATYANLVVPQTNYSTLRIDGTLVSGTPWDSALYTGVGVANPYGNRPVSYAQLSLNLLKQGWSNLLNTKDPQQQKIIVQPDTLLVSPQDALHAPLLVAPPQGVPYYPAIVGPTGSTANTAASGFPGGVFGANPFMGLGIKPVVARFLPDWSWAVGQGKKGIIFQERDPLEVLQEQVASGAAFEVDAYRFRSRRRYEVDWIGGGARFWWLGNDGSVVGAF